MFKLLLICFSVLLVVAGSFFYLCHQNNRIALAMEENSYSIYSAVLQEVYIMEHTQVIVVDDITRFPKIVKEYIATEERDLINHLPSLSKEMLDDLMANNRQETHLINRFNLSIRAALIKKEEIEELIHQEKDPYWKPFFNKYPKSPGFITLSKIGFNDQQNRALVYTSRHCGNLCGEGYFVVLEKDNTSWIVRHRLRIWVS